MYVTLLKIKGDTMKIEDLEPMTTNPEDLNQDGFINPFHQDLTSMGTQIGKNVTVLHMNFPSEVAESIVIVNTKTGERIRITLNE